mgnify:FL=1
MGQTSLQITANSYKGDDEVWPEYIKEREVMKGVCQKHFFSRRRLSYNKQLLLFTLYNSEFFSIGIHFSYTA